MIYIDIFVPCVSKRIEVRADEKRNVNKFKDELCLLLKKLLSEEEECVTGFELYDDIRKDILPDELTLSECGISGGSCLILV